MADAQVVIQNEVAPESEEYIQDMVEKGSAAVEAGNTHSTGQNLDIPEKFRGEDGTVNVEALLKSYQELEKKQGNKPEEEAPKQQEEEPKEQETEKAAKKQEKVSLETVEDAQRIATEKGLDFQALAKEFETTGELSQETYDKLASKDISKEVVDQFLDGQRALVQNIRNEVFTTVGGEDNYKEMVQWAKENLKPSEINAFNTAVSMQDVEFVKLAVAGLQQRYQATNGKPPSNTVGGKTQGDGSAVKPFRSRSEYVEMVSDKRYEKDPAFRQDVIDRLQVSDIF